MAAGGMNAVIAIAYVLIAGFIVQGLVRTSQLTTNPLAVATAAIFTTCALHHGHHALHLLTPATGSRSDLLALRSVFGEWHVVAIDALGAGVAVVYLSLRRNYKALLNTPSMFDDAVRRATEAQLRALALTDALTGIPNRAAYQRLADELSGRDVLVTVAYVDLDDFKGINDELGHDAGDRVLREVFTRLHEACGPDQHVFRLGGDELAVVCVGQAGQPAAGVSGWAQHLLAEPWTSARAAASCAPASGARPAAPRTGWTPCCARRTRRCTAPSSTRTVASRRSAARRCCPPRRTRPERRVPISSLRPRPGQPR